MNVAIGIGVADITKLKANGYYTINVRAAQNLEVNIAAVSCQIHWRQLS